MRLLNDTERHVETSFMWMLPQFKKVHSLGQTARHRVPPDAASLVLALGLAEGGRRGRHRARARPWRGPSPQISSGPIPNGERGLGVDWVPAPSTTGRCGDSQPRRMSGQGTKRRVGWPKLRLQRPDRFPVKVDGAGRPHAGRGGRGTSQRRLSRVPAPPGPGCRGHGLEGLGRLRRAQSHVSVST